MKRARELETRPLPDHAADEEACLARALAGERSAYDALVRRHYPWLYACAFRLLGNPEDAEDLAQECFVRGYRALAHHRGGSFAGWLRGILVHLAQDRFRREGRRPAREALPGELAGPRAREPLAELKGRELVRAVAAAVRGLPAALRIALVLRALEALEYEEIAAATGVTPATARTRVMKARKRLLGMLGQYFERREP
jgi:RNA polymerase sigma-70 factor (ECF subfamily)